ncbi:unnamed protein product [Brassica oleracea]
MTVRKEIARSILAQSKWSRLEIEVSMDAARVSPCGSPCNSLRSWVLQPIYKFRSGQGSNPWADTPARDNNYRKRPCCCCRQNVRIK